MGGGVGGVGGMEQDHGAQQSHLPRGLEQTCSFFEQEHIILHQQNYLSNAPKGFTELCTKASLPNLFTLNGKTDFEQLGAQ